MQILKEKMADVRKQTALGTDWISETGNAHIVNGICSKSNPVKGIALR
jgi:hypothetical protein